MINVNSSQVQSTNDASTASKCSTVKKKYYKDDFIEHFIGRIKARASLIHLGYYTRAVTMFKLITRFIEYLDLQNVLKFQIISCGSGFDTTYWRLMQAKLLHENSIFIEIDFPNVIERKILLINQSESLKSYMSKSSSVKIHPKINKMNNNFFLLEADLEDLNELENLFNKIEINYNIPTLFLSECAITYMKDYDSDKLIQFMVNKFKNSSFINYEQIHPYDGFGKVMLRHFNKLQSSLYSVAKYPDCESHIRRYKELGFQKSCAVSEWNALLKLTTEEERKTAFNLEVFDEYEEFHLKCVHYVLAVAGSNIVSNWVDLLPSKSVISSIDLRKYCQINELESNIELCRHSSCISNEKIYFFGGCNKQSRNSKIYAMNSRDFSDVTSIEYYDGDNSKFNMVYGSVVHFVLNKTPYFCLYGGRTSPDKICNDGNFVMLQLSENKLLIKLVIREGNPISRYRSTMVSLPLSEDEVTCWVFGGQTVNVKDPLSDFWQLNIKCDNEQNFTYTWKLQEKKSDIGPCGRMSHSCVACPKRFALYVTGGLITHSSTPLNDMWKWCCRSESWEKLELKGQILPRYGHTSHIVSNCLYLIGGINTISGLQPGIARIDLNELYATEFEVKSDSINPVLLFNHTTEIIEDEEDTNIIVFGGGGNCFSFGTYLNQNIHAINLNQLET